MPVAFTANVTDRENELHATQILRNVGVDDDYLKANLQVVKGDYGTSITLTGLETTQMGIYTTVSVTGKNFSEADARFNNEVVEASRSGSLLFTRGGRRRSLAALTC